MNVEIIRIKGIEYEINFDMMSIKVFDRDNEREVHKYLVQKPEDKDQFNMPQKYQRIYKRLEDIEKSKRKPKEDKPKQIPKKKRKKSKN